MGTSIIVDRYVPLWQMSGIEGVLCAAALIRAGLLPKDACVHDADTYYDSLRSADCENCPARDTCAVVLLEE